MDIKTDYKFELLELNNIRKNPLNSRKDYTGPEFDEMVASIDQQGVIQPIVVRKKPCTVTNTDYEVVAGNRRHLASVVVAENNGGIAGAVIPAIVRILTDDQAFEIMTIENLQRKNLTELEEAESFQLYLKKKGDNALVDLAAKTGIHPGYIRRRIGVLHLPRFLLAAWNKGDLGFGYMEQFLRIKDDKNSIHEYFDLIKGNWRIRTVSDLKKEIDNRRPFLSKARFDIKKCVACSSNTDVQKKLFDIDSEKTRCMNPGCYIKKSFDHVASIADKTTKRHGTHGWVMIDAPDKNKSVTRYGVNAFDKNNKPKAKCKACDGFVTIFEPDGSVHAAKACKKSSDCFYDLKSSGKTKSKDTTSPRVSWHGSHFRDDFYQRTLPVKFQEIKPDNEKTLRIALFAMIESHHYLPHWFANKTGIIDEMKPEDQICCAYVEPDVIFSRLKLMSAGELKTMIKEASLEVGLAGSAKIRELMAIHIGVDITTEFSITEEYLKKKTKAELIEFGLKHKIFDDKKAQDFLFEKLMKKRGKYTSCKKPELVRVFLESGVDLTGKVPDEILSSGV